MVKTCCVAGCKSESFPGCGVSFHAIPKAEDKKSIWLASIPVKTVTKYSKVCSLHFKVTDFEGPRNTLKPEAVPDAKDITDACHQRMFKVEKFFCRICAKTNVELLPIFGIGDKNYAELINRFLPIRVQAQDGRPQHLCSMCASGLTDWRTLVQKSRQSDEQFKLLYKGSNKIIDLQNVSVELPDKKPCTRSSMFCQDSGNGFPNAIPSFVCSKCNFEFNSKSLLELHYRVCNELKCYRCHLTFDALYDNYAHLKSCILYVCRGCEATFITAAQHRAHAASCSDEPQDALLSCKNCSFHTVYLDNFERHVAECWMNDFVDGLNEGRACENCDRYFYHDSEYMEHVEGCSVYLCSCGMRFRGLPEMFDHVAKCGSKKVRPKEEPSDTDSFYDDTAVNYEPDEDEDCLQAYETRIDDLFDMLKRRNFNVRADAQCVVCEKYCKTKRSLRSHLVTNHAAFKLITQHFSCTYCDTPCKSVQQFNAHSYYKHVPRRCHYCPKVCLTKFDMFIHIRKDHLQNGKNESCQICRSIVPKDEIEQHRRWHYEEDRKQCEECGRILLGVRQYVKHMSTHRCNAQILCPDCGKLVFRYSLNAHMRTHSKTTGAIKRRTKSRFDEKCPHCSKRFHQRLIYAKHVKAHERGTYLSYRCSHCNTAYATQAALSAHVRSHHKAEDPYCAECDLRFETLQEKYLHKRTEHSTFKFVYRCCDSTFSRYGIFEKHFIETHKDDGMQTVVKIFKDKPSPYVYQFTYATQEDGQPALHLACGHCGKALSSMGQMNLHIRIVHIGERLYHCSHCGLSFKKQSALTYHEYIHLNVKPYKCRICDQEFRQPQEWTKHEQKHLQDEALPRKRKRTEDPTTTDA